MDALVDRLADYDSLVEVGVGRRPDVAGALAAAGRDVTATDVREVPVPEGVEFVRDDLLARRHGPVAFYDVDALYARNLPPDLHAAALDVARAAGADLLFTTLGFDEPAIPVTVESLPGGTLYVARERN